MLYTTCALREHRCLYGRYYQAGQLGLCKEAHEDIYQSRSPFMRFLKFSNIESPILIFLSLPLRVGGKGRCVLMISRALDI